MGTLVGLLGSGFNLLLVVLGFSLIIFVHELGHFLAARWAGIRVLAFAIGFGQAVASYRKGMGWRHGSSEQEYRKLEQRGEASGISPTEYRINALPFGGYVKMLGQDDMDPTAVSDAPDSYQKSPVWKRMIVISAGVTMNMIMAALLFIVVFMVGLKTEPPKIGGVYGPASKAVATNADALGVEQAGLQAGDRVISIDGREPNSFNDISLASAMAKPGKPIHMMVERPGVSSALEFDVVAEKSPLTGLLDIGVEPARSAKIFDETDPVLVEAFESQMASLGVPGVKPGMRLVRVGEDTEIQGAFDLVEAMRASGGRPVEVVFEGRDGSRASGTLTPVAELMQGLVRLSEDRDTTIEHLLGLTPVMMVGSAPEGSRGYELGLREGDVFAQLGEREYPSVVEGIREIKAHAGRDIRMVLVRDGEEIALSVPVRKKDGTIGFGVVDTARESALLALPARAIAEIRDGAKPTRPPAYGVITTPGSRIVRVAGEPVKDFGDVRAALVAATSQALDLQRSTIEVPLELELPIAPVEGGRVQSTVLTLGRADVEALHQLGWLSPISTGMFEPEEFTLRAEHPWQAVTMGLQETQRVMLTTYATFDRLFRGTVKVEHLKGPVGIAHIGTRIADRGFIWLLFFMALISVNLAVINFLPLPIVDGGQFIMLVIEQVSGRPVPVAIQNWIAMAGLVVIGAVFLLVTFNDIKAILGV